MGLRSRTSRANRRRRKERAHRRRIEGLTKARPRCRECRSVMVADEKSDLDIWSCGSCGKIFLRAGPAWLTELDSVASAEHEFAVAEFLRRVA